MVLTLLTTATRGMIGEREFKRMKKDAIFLNDGRGQVVVERDFVRGLEERWICAAGLDVFAEEPIDSNHPLLQMNKLSLSLKLEATYETRHVMYVDAAKQCVAGVHVKRPKHVIEEQFFCPKRCSLLVF